MLDRVCRIVYGIATTLLVFSGATFILDGIIFATQGAETAELQVTIMNVANILGLASGVFITLFAVLSVISLNREEKHDR